MEVTLDGERLTASEVKELLAKSDGLALIRGRWVEVDSGRLSRMLDHFQEVRHAAADWAQVVAGPWLSETLKGLRSLNWLAGVESGRALNGVLRPYQCKQVATVFYGIGARLDQQPELLLKLREARARGRAGSKEESRTCQERRVWTLREKRKAGADECLGEKEACHEIMMPTTKGPQILGSMPR